MEVVIDGVTYVPKQSTNEIWLANMESAKSITKLEDDIDKPIRKCVAMLALLGLQPVWSCCGFNYDGQPIHKDHTYGNAYISIIDDTKCEDFIKEIQEVLNEKPIVYSLFSWKGNRYISDGERLVGFETTIVRDGQWNTKQSIHFSEHGATYIKYLEMMLLEFEDRFLDKQILVDTNVAYKLTFPHWQYPAKEPWEFTKEYVLEMD